jgi:hypothetical protein
VTAGFPQFLRLNQVQNVNLQAVENRIGFRHGEYSLSFQYVVEMGLGNPGMAGEAAFRVRTALYPAAKLFKESVLQIVECHGLDKGLFLTEIGYK